MKTKWDDTKNLTKQEVKDLIKMAEKEIEEWKEFIKTLKEKYEKYN